MSPSKQTRMQEPKPTLVTKIYRDGRLHQKVVDYEVPTLHVVEERSSDAGHFGAAPAVLLAIGIGLGYFLNAWAIASV